MKKSTFLVLLFVLTGGWLYSQVTITSSNIGGAGNVYYYSSNQSVTISDTATGSGNLWNIETISATGGDTIPFLDPSGFPSIPAFSTANIGIPEGDSSWIYAELNSSQLVLLGEYSVDSGMADTSVLNAPFLKFPTSLGSGFLEHLQTIVVERGGEVPPIGVDSTRTDAEFKIRSEVIAEGKLALPNGVWNVLLQKWSFDRFNYYYKYDSNTQTWEHFSDAQLNTVNLDSGYAESDDVALRFWSDDSLAKFMVGEYNVEDGEFIYTNISNEPPPDTTNVAERSGHQGVKLYPNPVDDQLTIQTEVKNVRSAVVTNMIGEQVLAAPIRTGTTQLDLSSLPGGNYLVEFRDAGNKPIQVSKIQKH